MFIKREDSLTHKKCSINIKITYRKSTEEDNLTSVYVWLKSTSALQVAFFF